MARSARFERATTCLEGRCSIQLSYERKALTRNVTPKFGESTTAGSRQQAVSDDRKSVTPCEAHFAGSNHNSKWIWIPGGNPSEIRIENWKTHHSRCAPKINEERRLIGLHDHCLKAHADHAPAHTRRESASNVRLAFGKFLLHRSLMRQCFPQRSIMTFNPGNGAPGDRPTS